MSPELRINAPLNKNYRLYNDYQHFHSTLSQFTLSLSGCYKHWLGLDAHLFELGFTTITKVKRV